MLNTARIVVVGHHKRRESAVHLSRKLGAHLLMDEGNHGAAWNHRRALGWCAMQSGPSIVMEDDALPCADFRRRADDVLKLFPNDLVSFYLGTGYPVCQQRRIATALEKADLLGLDHIALPMLMHGVCYAFPTGGAVRVMSRLSNSKQIDFDIGRAWGLNIIYSLPSLVDHADEPSMERHSDKQPRVLPRRAWRFAGA